MIYFDNAATSGHKPDSVIYAMNYAVKNLCANPGRSGHSLSQKAAMAVYNSREILSDYFNSNGPETVVFTLNCTQSINFVLKGVLKQGDHVIVSDLEHNAVMRPLKAMNIDFSIAEVSLDDDDKTVLNFSKMIKPNTKMIFCTSTSNVLGKILPLTKIGKLCKQKGLLFGVDAAQGAGVIPIDMKLMNIDYLCIAAHKGLYCPMGLGVLIARAPINNTIIEGGTGTDSINFNQPKILPEMFESGTVNVPAILTVKAGINFIKKYSNCIFDYETKLIRLFYNNLQNSDIVFYTNPHQSGYAPVICFNVKNVNSEKTTEILSKNGFALRGGLHCAPMAHQKIGTLKSGAVRFSPSVFNTEQEVVMLIRRLKFSKKYQKHY